MKLPNKMKGIIGAVVVAVVVVSGIGLSLVMFPQPHMAFISEQKASSILNETFVQVSTTVMAVNNLTYPGATSIEAVSYSGLVPVGIIVIQYDSTSNASALYTNHIPGNSAFFTANATYRGYLFSYQNYIKIGTHSIGPLQAWCLLKNYVVEIYSFGHGTYSNTTILNFIHAQMDAML